MEFCVLGEVEVRHEGVRLPIRGARQLALLTVLLVEANRPVTTDQLVDRVWGTARRPDRPANALQTQLTLLRRALTSVADVTIGWEPASGYRLTVDEGRVDVHTFRTLVDQARGAEPARATSLLTDALALWRGSPFAGLDTPWLTDLRAALARQRLAAQLELNDLRLRQGMHLALLPSLTDLAAEHPLDEHLAGQLMLALYRSGRASDARQHFHEVRHRLATELGTDPTEALSDLHQRMLTNDRTLDLVASAAVTMPVPRQLPAAPHSFTGRRSELEALSAAVDAVAEGGPVIISALAGPGGIGKTWLALQWAHQNLDRFPDGQLFVDLRGFSADKPPLSPGTVVRGWLDAFGVDTSRVPADPDARAAMVRSLLAGKRMVIVLDNASDTAQVVPLLPGTATCTVLVTSRRHLTGLITQHGARQLAIDVLSDSESHALLVSRLGAERVAAEPEAVAELIVLCGGYPLALGIVAGRAATYPDLALAPLAEELRGHRLAALDEDDRAASLPAVLSWSYRALTAQQAKVFGLLGSAPGVDVSLPAAAALAGLPEGETRAVLRALQQASLLYQEVPGRYRMHDLIRLYAAEQAGSDVDAFGRLIGYYLDEVARAMADFGTAAAIAWLDAERANLVAVIGQAEANGRPHEAIRLAATLSQYLNVRAHHEEALVIHQHAVRAAVATGEQAAQAAALGNLGLVHVRWADYEKAFEYYQQALPLYRATGDRAGESGVLNNLGLLHWRWGSSDEALEHYSRSLAVAREAGDRAAEANALDFIGLVHQQLGRCEEAYACHERALVIHREVGNRTGEANSLDDLGLAYCRAGDYTRAIDHHQQARAAYRALGNRTGEADALDGLGTAHLRSGDPAKALEFHHHAIEIYQELGNRTGEASAHNGTGEALQVTGHPTKATTHHHTALHLAQTVGVRHEQARAHHGLATAHHTLNDIPTARHHWHQALTLYTALNEPEAATVRAQLTDLDRPGRTQASN
ncbi:tetratricopeptide repeat protein [Actinocrispum sp. NPDC049592]|uniref:AfsR/SARP family transcriptional regulator n=1 Tax=Actinocrispum sp. NPDC049592 TaxID=3154835 RepID=UPI003414CEB4